MTDQHYTPEVVDNSICVSLGGDRPPSFIINGVEMSGAISRRWQIENRPDDHTVSVTVTFEVAVP